MFQQYAKILATISDFASDRIVLQLVGLEHDWPISRMQAVIGSLRRYTRFVAVQLPLETAAFESIASCGAAIACVALASDFNSRDITPALERFCKGAERSGLTTVAEQVSQQTVMTVAIAAGFSFLHVEYPSMAVERPAAASTFELTDLYDRRGAQEAMDHHVTGSLPHTVG